jgi:3-oxoacyl-[acyl-carrier-protein] synthase II
VTRDDRIWITGVGVVTALGNDVARTWTRLVRGDRGLAPLGLFDTTGQRASMVGSVLDAPELVPPQQALREGRSKEWSRTSAFAWKAAAEAITQAGLSTKARRVGLVIGGTTGGMFETEALLADLHANPNRTESLVDMISQPLTATGDRLVESLGPFARVRTLCSACSSGANAFAVAAMWLLSGVVDAVVAGGSDGLCRLTLSGFNALAATDPDPCRPFDGRRKGLNLGEGAGFAVLERASTVRERGGEVVAELAGWAIGAEAHHITNPEPTGAAAARVIGRCLRRAGLSPREVDYVNAHGTGTPLNDAMESAGLRLALGADVERVPVSSSKGQVGHTLGAAGAVEAVFSALAVKLQAIPPTMGLEEPDVACPLVHVLREGRPARVRAAMSNSFGFGGMDTVLLVTEPELGPPLSHRARRVVVTGAAALTPRGLDDGDSAAPLVDGSLDGAPAVPAGPLAIPLGQHLDTGRARRLDRPARLAAVAVQRAIAQAETGGARLDLGDVGIVLGTAFGSLDPSAAFMHRLFEKGPRFASPAEFPNLVPSSPVGHVSIYFGLRGASFATADLGTSGESAVLQGIELIVSGDEEVVVAGSVEEASDLVERILFSLHAGALPSPSDGARRPRSEGAATLVLEAEAHAEARGRRPLACVEGVWTWTDAPNAPITGPRDAAHAHVVAVHDGQAVTSVLAGTGWASVARTSLTKGAGEHEGVGGTALVAAVAMVHRGDAREVLVVGVTEGRGYAMTLVAPAAR